MLLAIVLLQTMILLAVLLLLRRRVPVPVAPDARMLQVPDQLARVDTRADALDSHVRAALAQMRADLLSEAHASRDAHSASGAALRSEITHTVAALGSALTAGLDSFRADNQGSAESLRASVHTQLDGLAQRLSGFMAEHTRLQLEAQTALHSRLADLGQASLKDAERLRTVVQERLDHLNAANAMKLEEMRSTVDEKLHATLHTRLTESFGQVTDQLNKVHTGLGEMSKLSEGVDDLSRIFTNVKSRGGFAEVQLGMLLEQMLAPSQFLRNARIKPNTQEVVEFAVRFPGHHGDTLLPIDAKFPREAWERLESAYAANDPELLAATGKVFEAAIRTEGKRICEKYIHPPRTTPHAIMFLPTEGLYAEVMRRDALQAEIQSKCQVTIAGPSTLSAILTSFQMGFHMLALQEKGDEVWKVLESAKTEFGKFGTLMDKVEGDVGKIQKTLGEVGVRTRAINRTLREVSDPAAELANGTLRLVANGDEN